MNLRIGAFAHKVTREPWGLDGPAKVDVRRLKDLADCFALQEGKDSKEGTPEKEIYKVISPAEQEPSDLTYAVTIIMPGKVGDEYHMTRGHFHKSADAGELYYGLAGSGVILMQDRLGSVTEVDIAEGAVVYIPPGLAHRSVNTGQGELVFLAVYSPQAGHDYESIVRRGFSKRVVERDGKVEMVDA
ncbi:MAG: glucose-6-phosphate isomerase family protein [Methanobacteriota archaeon]